MHYMIAD